MRLIKEMTHLKVASMLSLAALLLVGCSNDDEGGKTVFSTQNGEGTVTLRCEVDAKAVATESKSDVAKFEIPAELIPVADDFEMTIGGSYIDHHTNEKVVVADTTYSTVADFNDDLPYLNSGSYSYSDAEGYKSDNNYNVVITHGDEENEGENMPYFRGETDFVVVARKDSSEVNIAAALANSIVTVETSDFFDRYYKDAKFTVKWLQKADENSVVEPEDSFDFAANDGKLLFVKSGSTLILSGEATTVEGESRLVKFAATEIGVTKTQTLSRVVVDAADLIAKVQVTVVLDDNETELVELKSELNPEL